MFTEIITNEGKQTRLQIQISLFLMNAFHNMHNKKETRLRCQKRME